MQWERPSIFNSKVCIYSIPIFIYKDLPPSINPTSFKIPKIIFWETTSLSNRCLLSASIPGQASVAKAKAKKKEKDDASAEVVPQTVTEKVTDAISDALKEAGHARTSAITLSGLEFADNLSTAMKDHANKIESLYGSVQKAIKTKVNDKELGKILVQIEGEAANTKKLQATFGLRC